MALLACSGDGKVSTRTKYWSFLLGCWTTSQRGTIVPQPTTRESGSFGALSPVVPARLESGAGPKLGSSSSWVSQVYLVISEIGTTAAILGAMGLVLPSARAFEARSLISPHQGSNA